MADRDRTQDPNNNKDSRDADNIKDKKVGETRSGNDIVKNPDSPVTGDRPVQPRNPQSS